MTALPEALRAAVAPHVGGEVRRAGPVGGGCIGEAWRVEAAAGVFFLKAGRGAVAATFGPEAAGLAALRAAGSPLVVPEVHAVGEERGAVPGFLLTAWIEQGPKPAGFWEAFGAGLAALHRHTADRYGFGTDNFIGRLPQFNGWMSSWPDFFRDRRLGPQVQRAREAGRWRSSWNRPYETLLARLDELLPETPPASILHGDLWSGNFLATAEGPAALIDPAVYHGHRETDLALTELFGGFDAPFYAAYRAAWPLEGGYDERREVYNLYHLLNHLNHFGSSYAGAVARTLDRFGG